MKRPVIKRQVSQLDPDAIYPILGTDQVEADVTKDFFIAAYDDNNVLVSLKLTDGATKYSELIELLSSNTPIDSEPKYHGKVLIDMTGGATTYTFPLSTTFPGIPEGIPNWHMVRLEGALGGTDYIVYFGSGSMNVQFFGAVPNASYYLFVDLRDFAPED